MSPGRAGPSTSFPAQPGLALPLFLSPPFRPAHGMSGFWTRQFIEPLVAVLWIPIMILLSHPMNRLSCSRCPFLFVPEHALHGKGLQKQIDVGELVSSHDRERFSSG